MASKASPSTSTWLAARFTRSLGALRLLSVKVMPATVPVAESVNASTASGLWPGLNARGGQLHVEVVLAPARLRVQVEPVSLTACVARGLDVGLERRSDAREVERTPAELRIQALEAVLLSLEVERQRAGELGLQIGLQASAPFTVTSSSTGLGVRSANRPVLSLRDFDG